MHFLIKALACVFTTFINLSVIAGPVIIVNSDIVSSVGKEISLDASQSYDTDSSELRFNWSVLSSPNFSINRLLNSNTNVSSLVLDKVGNYNILLSIENKLGEVSEQIISVSSYVNYDEVVYGPLNVEVEESCLLKKGTKSSCELKEYSFPVSDTQSTYTFIAESKGISTAIVTINGDDILSFNSFGADNTFVYKQLSLEAMNSMTIKLGGRVSESLDVIIVKNIEAIPINNPPSVSVQDILFSGNLGGESTIFGSDPDGNSLSFSIVDEPLYGRVRIEGNKVFYVPDRSSSRDDRFIIAAVDDGFPSKTSIKEVNVNFVSGNIPPLVSTDESISHGEAVLVNLNVEDNYGQFHRGEVIQSATNGSAIIYNPNYTDELKVNYVPDPSFIGDDTFVIRVYDDGSPVLYSDHVVNVSVLVNNLPYINYLPSIDTAQGVSSVKILNIIDINELQDVSVSVSVDPSFGTVVYDSDTQRLSVHPNDSFFGNEQVEIVLSDNASSPGVNTYLLDVQVRENQTPTPVIREISYVNPGTTKDIPFSFRDENSNQVHTYEIIGQAEYGDIELLPDTFTIRYSANNDFLGEESFTLAITDNGSPSKTGLYDFVIKAKYNQPPSPTFTINNPRITFPVTTSIILSSGDPDGGDQATYSILNLPEHGIAVANPFNQRVIDYTPDEGFDGIDYITVRVMDNGEPPLFKDVIVPINVYENSPPEINERTYSISEGGSQTIYLNGRDIDRGQKLTYEIISGPSLGTVKFLGSYIEYQANNETSGTDYITVKVTDNGSPSLSAFGVISIDIIENRAPSIDDISTFVSKGLSKRIYPRGRDLDGGQSLTYSITVPPSNGTVEISEQYSFLTYLPNPDFVGLDEFEVTVTDNGIPNKASSAIVSINVEEEDPVDASISDIRTLQGVRYSGLINITDDNLDNTFDVQFSVYPIGGTAELSKTYISSSKKRYFRVNPKREFYGSDIVGFNIQEANSLSNYSKNVFGNINVQENSAPSPYINGPIETIQGKSKKIDVFHNDIDVEEYSQNISYKIIRQPLNGSVSIGHRGGEKAEVTYTPALNFFGQDSFIISVSDDGLASHEVQFEVPISVYENSAPTASVQGISLTTGSVKSVTVDASDIDDNQVLSYSIYQNGNLGEAFISSDGLLEYHASSQVGEDTVTIRISDNGLPSKFIDIILNISIIENTPPVLSSLPINIFQGETGSTLVNVSDSDEGQTFSFTISSNGLKGLASINQLGEVVYSPDLGATGSDSFIVNVKDSGMPIGSTDLTVNVNITANSVPVLTALPSSISIFQSGVAELNISFTDSDTTQSHNFVILSQSSLGNATIDQQGKLNFSANSGLSGTGELRVGVQDNAIPPSTGELIIPIEIEGNTNPVIVAESFQTFQSTSYIGDFSISDVDAWQNLSVAVKAQASSGTVSIDFNTRKFSYSPNVGFFGQDAFTLEVSDSAIPSGKSEVVVNVDVVKNNNPTILADSFSTFQSTAYTGEYTVSDEDSGQQLEVIIKRYVNSGSLTLDTLTKSFIYDPISGFVGEDSFILEVRDSALPSGVAEVLVTIQVTPNSIPVLDDIELSILQRSISNSHSITFTDVDDFQEHSFGIQTAPQKGIAEISEVGELIYTPYVSASGSDTFRVFVSDNAQPLGTGFTDVVVNIVDNEAPSIVGATSTDVTVDETVNLSYFATDSNPNNNFRFSINSTDLNGSASIDPISGDFSYSAYVKGTETVTIIVTDDGVPEMSSELLLTINSYDINHPPLLSAEDIEVLTGVEGTTLVNVEDLDVDQEHSFSILNPPVSGQAIIGSSGEVSYTSNENFVGSDSITIRVEDDGIPVLSTDITISINVLGNSSPMPDDLTIDIVEGMTISHTVIPNDPDLGQNHSYQILSHPASGVLSVDTDGELQFTAPHPFSGELNATVRITDNGFPSKYGDFNISFNVSENAAPVIISNSFSVNKNSSVIFPIDYEDTNTGQEHSFEIIGLPSNGVVSLDKNEITYTPNSDFVGQDSVTLKIRDNGVPFLEGQKTLSINVLDSSNTPPVIGGVFHELIRSNNPYYTFFYIEDVVDDGEVVSYEWNFGDGSPTYTALTADDNVEDIWHMYRSTGVYSVSVKAVDDEGAESIFSFDITISNTQTPVSKQIVGSNSYSVGDTMSFDGSSSYDEDGTVVTHIWEISNEEHDIEEYVESVSSTYVFQNAGVYELCLYVFDEHKATDESCQEIYVEAVGPDIHPFVKIKSTSSVGNTPLEITFNGQDSYSENSSIESYFWRVNERGVESFYSGPTLTHTFYSTGTHDVSLTVVDEDGNSSENDYEVFVGDINSSNFGIKVGYREGTTVGIQIEDYAGLYDSEKTILIVNNERFTTDDLDYTFPSPGLYTIEAEVYDYKGIRYNLSHVVDVGSVGPLANASISNNYPEIDESINLDLSNSTFEGNALFYIEFGDGTNLLTTDTAITHSYSTLGTKYMRIYITDDSGLTHGSLRSIHVSEGNVPNVDIGLNTNSGESPLSISADSLSTDSDGSVVYERWVLRAPGGKTFIFEENPLLIQLYTPGFYELHLYVTDDSNNIRSSVEYINVEASSGGNNIPIFSVDRWHWQSNLPIGAGFEADYDDSFDVTRAIWNFDDGTGDVVFDTDANGDLPDIEHNFVTTGTYNITVTLEDSLGNSGSYTFSHVVEETQAPVAIIDSSSTSGDFPVSITFDGSNSYDLDGSIVSYFWDIEDFFYEEGESVTIDFNSAGVFTLNLYVLDDKYGMNHTQVDVEVTDGTINIERSVKNKLKDFKKIKNHRKIHKVR